MTKKQFKTMLLCACLTCLIFATTDASKANEVQAVQQQAQQTQPVASQQTQPAPAVQQVQPAAAQQVQPVANQQTQPAAVKPAQQAIQPVDVKPAQQQTQPAAAKPVQQAQPAVAKPQQTSAKPNQPIDIKKNIVDMALKMGVDPYIALSIAKLESNFDQAKKNPSGAVGLFQLMPNTAKVLGINPYIMNDNIRGGLMYYKQLYKRYGSMELALAAYNAGPGNVAKYKGVPPFKETQAFISKIKKEYATFKADPQFSPGKISNTL